MERKRIRVRWNIKNLRGKESCREKDIEVAKETDRECQIEREP